MSSFTYLTMEKAFGVGLPFDTKWHPDLTRNAASVFLELVLQQMHVRNATTDMRSLVTTHVLERYSDFGIARADDDGSCIVAPEDAHLLVRCPRDKDNVHTGKHERSTRAVQHCGGAHAIPADTRAKMTQRADEVARLFLRVHSAAVRALYVTNYVEIVALLASDGHMADAVCFLYHCFLQHGS
eukprot:m.31983 g.31983  ORF g.31983 m.31983 type:complete len:184 (-) comp14071_c0_seq1:36-587(-)